MTTATDVRQLNARLVQVDENGIIVPLRSPTLAKFLRFVVLSGAQLTYVRLGDDTLVVGDIVTLQPVVSLVTIDTLDTDSTYRITLTKIGGSPVNYDWDADADADVTDTRDGLLSVINGVAGWVAEAVGTDTLRIYLATTDPYAIALEIVDGTGTFSLTDPPPVQGGDQPVIRDYLDDLDTYYPGVDVTHIGLKTMAGETSEILFYDVGRTRYPANSPTT